MIPKLLFTLPNDHNPILDTPFLRSIEEEEQKAREITSRLEPLSASLFSFAVPSDEIQKQHALWRQRLCQLQTEINKCESTVILFYENLPFIEPWTSIPPAMKKIQALYQRILFTAKEITNLLSLSQSPIYCSAVDILKNSIKSYEEFAESSKDPRSRYKKLYDLCILAIEKMSPQKEDIKPLTNEFLTSQIITLHNEILIFFMQTEKSIQTVAKQKQQPPSDLEFFSELFQKLCSNFFTQQEEKPKRELEEESFDKIVSKFQSLNWLYDPAQELCSSQDFLMHDDDDDPSYTQELCTAMSNLTNSFKEIDLDQEFRFQQIPSWIAPVHRLLHTHIDPIIVELEEVAKGFQGLQKEIKQRVDYICQTVDFQPRIDCSSLEVENLLYIQVRDHLRNKLDTAREKFYNNSTDGTIRLGLYYSMRLLGALHNCEEIRQIFEFLISDDNYWIFERQQPIFDYISNITTPFTPDSTPLHHVQSLFLSTYNIAIMANTIDKELTIKFKKKSIESLIQIISIVGKKTLEIKSNPAPFWKAILRKEPIFGASCRLPKPLQLYLIKEITEQLHFSTRDSAQLNFIIYMLEQKKIYKSIFKKTLEDEVFNVIYLTYTNTLKKDIPTAILKDISKILPGFTLCSTRNTGSFTNYIHYLKNCVLMNSLKKRIDESQQKNPLSKKTINLIERAESKRIQAQKTNCFLPLTSVDQTLPLAEPHQIQALLSDAFWGNQAESVFAEKSLGKFLAELEHPPLFLTPHIHLLLAAFVWKLQLKQETKGNFLSTIEKSLFNELCRGYITTPIISLALRDMLGLVACEELLYSFLTPDLEAMIKQYRGEKNYTDWKEAVKIYIESIKNPSKNVSIEIHPQISPGYKEEITSLWQAIQSKPQKKAKPTFKLNLSSIKIGADKPVL